MNQAKVPFSIPICFINTKCVIIWYKTFLWLKIIMEVSKYFVMYLGVYVISEGLILLAKIVYEKVIGVIIIDLYNKFNIWLLFYFVQFEANRKDNLGIFSRFLICLSNFLFLNCWNKLLPISFIEYYGRYSYFFKNFLFTLNREDIVNIVIIIIYNYDKARSCFLSIKDFLWKVTFSPLNEHYRRSYNSFHRFCFNRFTSIEWLRFYYCTIYTMSIWNIPKINYRISNILICEIVF